MSKQWRILYCDAAEQECPVTDFIETCPPRHQAKILRFLALLEEMGPSLHRPYADILYEGIYELRIKLSGDHVRLLYFFCFQKFIVLYHGFFKRSQRVPDQLVRRVIRYRNILLERTNAKKLESLIDEDL
jgi:phage-related protein